MAINFKELPTITEEGGTYRIPVADLWTSLRSQGENPVNLIKYVAGQQGNPLEKQAQAERLTAGSFYLKFGPDNPIEVGLIQYPDKGGDLVDRRDLAHKHDTCSELFVVTEGGVILRTGINHATREAGIERIPDRYHFEDGQDTILALNQTEGLKQLPLPRLFSFTPEGLEFLIAPGTIRNELDDLLSEQTPVALMRPDGLVAGVAYTTHPGDYHILTDVAPRTSLTLIKTANSNWNGTGNWSDRHLHLMEQSA